MLQNPEELLQKIKQLESELKKVKSCKRYGLVWEDKPEIFEEKAKNALPVLKEEKNLRIEDDENKPNNIIIEGDNYHSLSALSYTHKGKIDVIYIDPPYNTGNKDFIYNDSFVDKEDSYRHSKWLSFMSKRLRLAKNLLSENGVIFISIDDNEFAQLKLLCDEIFGENNFLQDIIWKSRSSISNDAIISLNHNHTLCYFKNKKNINKNHIFKLEPDIKGYSNSDNDVRGLWKPVHIEISGVQISKGLLYEIIDLNGNKYYPKKGSCWRFSKSTFEKLLNENKIIFDKKGKNKPKYKQFLKDISKTPTTIWEDVGTTTSGTNELKKIFGDKVFTNPKPISLILKILKLSSKPNSTILDFFAGSGTTGHAVMELNKEDLGNRQFILCSSRENTKENPDKNICKNITYERNKRVINGYTNSKGEKIEGLGGNLRYYTTEFIKTDKSIDDLRYSFIDMCDDLLCIKENTFTEVKLKNAVPELRLFKKGQGELSGKDKRECHGVEKYTAILYDIHHFKDLVKLLEVLDGKISVYIFSLSKDIFEEELEYLNKNTHGKKSSWEITVQNIPDDILQTYKKIFNF